jgi:type IV pilus assembly protein PilO
MTKTRQWSVFTVIAVLAIIVAGWFLLVSPQRGQVKDLNAQTASQNSANASLQSQVAQLEQQKQGLPAQQRLLDKIATKIPASPELPTLIRQLSAAAKASGVDLVSLAPSPPTAVAATAATGTVAAPATTSPLNQIPVTIQVSGSYFNITSFFRSLEKLNRALLVSDFQINPGDGSNAGSHAAAPDALTGQLSAVVFESPAAPAATAPQTLTPTTQDSTAPAASN